MGACRFANSETFQFLGMPLRGGLRFSVLPFQSTPHLGEHGESFFNCGRISNNYLGYPKHNALPGHKLLGNLLVLNGEDTRGGKSNLRRLDNTVGDGIGGQFSDGAYTGSLHDAVLVELHGSSGDIQGGSDLLG